MTQPKPELRKEEGFTYIDNVVVNAKPGIVMRPSVEIKKECEKYIPRSAYLVNKAGQDANCLSCTELMLMEIQMGKEVTIKVEGEDEKAEKIALRLYSALKSPNAYELDFDVFEEQD